MRGIKRECQRYEEGKKIWWRCEQQSLGAVVSESADYRGEEIVEGLSGNKSHLQNDEHVQFAVLECLL